MKFTIGIVHGEQTAEWAMALWNQFRRAGVFGNGDDRQVEFLFVGPAFTNGRTLPYQSMRHIEFDEKLNGKAWITKKKNLITEHAYFDNIVYMHDYITPDMGWYNEWCKFGEDFKIANNAQLITAGDGGYFRHSDWTIDPYLVWDIYPEWHWKFWDVALPYEAKGLSKLQYISGQYWVAKKSVMEEFPLNETLAWGDAEDIEWSRRVREKYEFSMNFRSAVHINKPDKWKPGLLAPDILKELCTKHNVPYTY